MNVETLMYLEEVTDLIVLQAKRLKCDIYCKRFYGHQKDIIDIDTKVIIDNVTDVRNTLIKEGILSKTDKWRENNDSKRDDKYIREM